jgi:PhnB protein
MVNKVPEGFSTITPSLMLENCAEAIELYKAALGATEDYRMNDAKGKIVHACLTVGDSKIFLADVNPAFGENGSRPSQGSFYLYLDDCDAAFERATQAGMKEVMQPEDMFWGDRLGSVKDKNNIHWTLATHVRDVSEAEMKEGQKKMFGSKAA